MVSAARLPTGVRRSRAAQGRIHPHPVRMQALGPDLLVRAADAEFLPALLHDLRRETWRDLLAAPERRLSRAEDGEIALPPPIQGIFSLAVAEVHCTVFGMPRLDPAAIESAGMVVRRIGPGGRAEGWMSAGPRRRGWLPIADPDADPDPNRRLGVRTGNPAVDGPLLKARLANQLSEQEHPMFVAPPDVAAATGRTIVLGIVPTASAEASEAALEPPDFTGMEAELATHFGIYLSASRDARPLPFAGELLSPDLVTGPTGRPRDAFFAFLRLLTSECDAFGTSPEANELRALLGQITLRVIEGAANRPTDMRADIFLTAAAACILGDSANVLLFRMPTTWPPLDGALAARITAAATRCIGARFAGLAPQRARFEDPTRSYIVRAFVRIRCEEGCPGRIVWCQPESSRFRILPWWAGSAKPVTIPLPDITDPTIRKQLRSGVSFAVPPALANFINQDHTETLGGAKKPERGSNLGIAWLCSLSIPIITVCAFIVLAIVVALLDLIFRWIPLFRICLPIPRTEKRS